MCLFFVWYINVLVWSGILVGEYKVIKKVLKRVMCIKFVDFYFFINYVFCMLFMGKYEKVDKIYVKYYNELFRFG